MISKGQLLFIDVDKTNKIYKNTKYAYSNLLQYNITISLKNSNVTLIITTILAELKLKTRTI